MSWLTSLGIAVLTSLVAMFAAGFVAELSVRWYRISSFEGGSGYFVVGKVPGRGEPRVERLDAARRCWCASVT